jgi:class 3 adenylate cyclase
MRRPGGLIWPGPPGRPRLIISAHIWRAASRVRQRCLLGDTVSEMEAPETRYVTVGDTEVAYQIIGEGPLDLVYHHGLCHLDLQWDVTPEAAFNGRLASFSRLILFDRRGSGASGRVLRHGFPTWEEWSEDLLAVLDAVGSQSAAIFAEAEAGATAVLFAAGHPERVNALVLGNTQARWAAADDYPIGVSPSEIDGIVELLEATWGKTDALRSLFPSLAGDEPVMASLARLCRAAATPRMAGALYRYIFEALDVREALGLVQAPTLVLQNRNPDPLLGPAHTGSERARYLAEHICNARLVEVRGDDYLFFGGDHEPVVSEVAEFLTGQGPPVEVDRILTTVLFTDIVASTERAAAEGDHRWRNLLDAHDRTVRSQLSRFRGKEIKTTGDGFLASFDGPARAIRSAQAIIEATGRLGIDLRAGLHTGECEVRDGDLAGLAVHIAARIGALAGPREVLISSTVKDLVAGSGIEFRERGEQELRGVPGRWRLYAVRD